MSQSLEQAVIAEISRIAALTPAELKKLSPHTHAEIKTVSEQLAGGTDLSARELARGRMLYKDFLTAIETGTGAPEQGIARSADFSLCLIVAMLVENDDMLAMSQAYQAQDWAAFLPALNAVTQHYEAQQRLYYLAQAMGDSAQDLYILRGSVGESAAMAAQFRLMTVLDAPADVIAAIWSHASPQSREMFAPSLKRLAKARKDAAVTAVIKDVLKDVKPARKPKAAPVKNDARAALEDSLKGIADELINLELGKLQKYDFDMHTGIRRTYDHVLGGKDQLVVSFGKALMGQHYERFVARLKSGSADFSGIDIEKAAVRSTLEQVEATYRVSKAYEARDWQKFCAESFGLAETLGNLVALLEVSAKLHPYDQELLHEIAETIRDGETSNKFFQLHMVMEAPAQAINYVWSRERKEDVAMYAPMLKQLADARGDAEVSQVVADLIANAQPPAKAAKPKAPRGPKQ